MDEFISTIQEALKEAFAWLKNLAHRIIHGVLSFMRDIVGWFRGLNLNRQKHSPFILNGKSPEFVQLIKNAPVINAGVFEKDAQIFEGVLDEETGEIIHSELLGADMLDEKTKITLGKEPVVVLN